MSDINIFRGDTANLDIVVNQAGSTSPADLSNSTVFFTVKEQRKDPDSLAVVAKCSPFINGINITSPTQGMATVMIPPAETAALLTGPHWYDVQVTDSAGDIATLTTGRFIVEADITRRIIC